MDDSADQTAFVAALTEVQGPLRLYIQSLLPGDFSAADVAQQANSTAWNKRGDFEAGTNFKAWIFAIARYEVLNYRKRQARDSRLVFSGDVEQLFADDLATREEITERRHEALRACLTKLRPQDRDLLMHRYDADAGTLDQFAGRVGRSVGGLKVTLHRLRNALLNCIEKQLALPGETT